MWYVMGNGDIKKFIASEELYYNSSYQFISIYSKYLKLITFATFLLIFNYSIYIFNNKIVDVMEEIY